MRSERSFSCCFFGILGFLKCAMKLILVCCLVFALFFASRRSGQLHIREGLVRRRCRSLDCRVSLLSRIIKRLGMESRTVCGSVFGDGFPDFAVASALKLRCSSDAAFCPFVSCASSGISILTRKFSRVTLVVKRVVSSLLQESSGDLRGVPSVLPVGSFGLKGVKTSLKHGIRPFCGAVIFRSNLSVTTRSNARIVIATSKIIGSVRHNAGVRNDGVIVSRKGNCAAMCSRLSSVLIQDNGSIGGKTIVTEINGAKISFTPRLRCRILCSNRPVSPLYCFDKRLDIRSCRGILVCTVGSKRSLSWVVCCTLWEVWA